jgi:PAS domain S-box-containing protein
MTEKEDNDPQHRSGVLAENPENALRMLMDNLQDCHVFIKDRESRFVVTNAHHLDALGAASLDAVTGKTDFDFFPSELAQGYYDDEQKVIRTGQAIIDRDERMIDAQHRERWLLTTKKPLLDAKGRITGIVGISRDITERKQREIQQEQQRLRLEELMAERTKELARLNH